ncbi:MAG TPA: TetR/AcrR family transcriptional regulator [Anaerolineales bacterium]|nr:TetR/AcrR family transcriptional regulator [Anaerolineales bacterium]
MPSEPRDLREQILSTAKGLFIQQGYHGLAMRQIAESLDVSKAALYYHFKDKEELFLAILEAYLDEMEAAIDRILAEPAGSVEQIRRFVEYVLAQPAEQRAIIRLASQEMGQLEAVSRKAFDKIYREKFIGKIEGILKAGMDAGEFRSMQPEVATWTLLGMMYPYFYPAHAGNASLSEETIRQIVTVYLEGMEKR